MIPTVLLPSFVVGRWWAVGAAALVWTVLLLATGTIGAGGIPTAAALAAANAAVGVAARRVLKAL